MKIKVIILDDHRMVRSGIRALLTADPEIEVVAEAASCDDLLNQLNVMPVDVVLVDVQLRNERGIDVVRQMRQMYPAVRAIAISMIDQESVIIELVQAGASGYLLEDSTAEELRDAIRAAVAGGTYFPPAVAEILLRRHLKPQETKRPVNPTPSFALTKREREILAYVVRDLSNQQIADRLFLSARTVENHKRSIFQKMGVRSSVGLVRMALEHGLMDESETKPT